jgi:triosephosphate isomerase
MVVCFLLNTEFMKPLIVGNWKMHKTLMEAVQYIETAGEALNQLEHVEVVLCPSFTALAVVEGLLRGTRVRLGAQNVAAWKDGAYTGEVSATMLAPHCQFVIVGHSERRKMGETPEMVNSKAKRAIEVGMQPIVCVSDESEIEVLATIKDKQSAWIVAFEPLSAIGSGKPEDPEVVKKMVAMIKKYMGSNARVIYGGSVTAENIRQYVPMCDGALPGGASLDPEGFLALCQQINK